MPIKRIWLTPTAWRFPFPPNPSCWEFPVPGSTTGRFSHRQKKFLFDTGLTRSPPVGLSSVVGALRLFSKGKDSLWGGSGFKQLCGKWELKGFIPVPILVISLWDTMSIPISSGISAPNICTTFGGRHYVYPTGSRMDVSRCHYRLAFPVCRVLGARSDT